MPPRAARGGTGFATPSLDGSYTVPAGFTWLIREFLIHNRFSGEGPVVVDVLGSGSTVPVPLFSPYMTGLSFTRIDGLYTVLRGGDVVRVKSTGTNTSVRATWSGAYLFGVSSAAGPS